MSILDVLNPGLPLVTYLTFDDCMMLSIVSTAFRKFTKQLKLNILNPASESLGQILTFEVTAMDYKIYILYVVKRQRFKIMREFDGYITSNIVLLERYFQIYGLDCKTRSMTNKCSHLCVAVKYYGLEVVKLLFKYGLELRYKCRDNCDILSTAISLDKLSILEFLLVGVNNQKIDPNIMNWRLYPLSTAVRLRDVKSAEILLRHGADPYVFYDDTETQSIIKVVMEGDNERMKTLFMEHSSTKIEI